MEEVTRDQFRLRSFRLRGDRMTKAQAEALLNHWNKFEVPLEGIINPREVFVSSKPKEVIIEIGSGMGEATAQIARAFPEIGFFAVELHKPGLGSLLSKIAESELKNIRLISEDARVLLEENLYSHEKYLHDKLCR